MRNHKIAPGIQKSLYPLEYNKNDPMSGFNAWAEHIRKENMKNMYTGSLSVIRINVNMVLWDKLKEKRSEAIGKALVDQALQIINSNTK